MYIIVQVPVGPIQDSRAAQDMMISYNELGEEGKIEAEPKDLLRWKYFLS